MYYYYEVKVNENYSVFFLCTADAVRNVRPVVISRTKRTLKKSQEVALFVCLSESYTPESIEFCAF